MTWITITAALLGALVVSGCEIEDCDGKLVPLRGSYTLAPQSEEDPMLRAEMDVSSDRLVVEYERTDGSRFRATYKITARARTFQ